MADVDRTSTKGMHKFWQNQTRQRSQTATPKRRIKAATKLPPEITMYLQQKLDKYVEEHKKAPSMEQFCRMIQIKYPYHLDQENNNSISRPIITSSSKIEGEGDIRMATKRQHNIDKSAKYPVWPLVIPNNCSYNQETGRMSVHHDQQRNKLTVYKPALEFIRRISSKIATISIVGRARTGKSLIAGELYAPGKTPCPFDLGHLMDACTYGIWVSAKTITHPYLKDTVVLIIDVEGTGFHEATKQNDMQLMVITLLISSYFIYNSKGSFDSSALDEIDFVTQLTETIHATPNDDSGQDFKKFFPIFMWLLRDVHLEPTIDGKTVSAREYFTKKVLRFEGGMSRKAQTRQQLKEMLIEMFQKLDAFTLPMPIADANKLRQLGTMPRVQLEKGFNLKLEKLYQKIMKATKCKVLFSKDGNGHDKFVQCTGPHLAGWIEKCVESVNDPNKVPQISSMTAAVMANVYRESKKNAIEQYQQLLNKGLNRLRNDDPHQPLDEKDIIDLHLKIVNTVLSESGSTLQIQKLRNGGDDEKMNGNNQINQEQLKVFNEFMNEIGHDEKAKNIGKMGIMYQILTKNMELSKKYCNDYLDNYFMQKINPFLEKSDQFEVTKILEQFKDLETKYYSKCKGPAKDECWAEFHEKRMREAIKNFEKCRGFNMEILRKEQEAAAQRERQRQLQQQYDEHKQQSEQQQKLMKDELTRMENKRKSEMEQHKLNIKQAEQRMRDLQQSHNNQNAELMRRKKQEIDAMNKRLTNMVTQHQRQLNSTISSMQSQINTLRNRSPQIVYRTRTVYRSGGGCLIQ